MSKCLLFLPILINSVTSDLRQCFISHKNIKISCGKPLDIKSPITVTECQQLCLKFNTQCQTIQYDYYRNICEIFSVPSPLKMNTTEAMEHQKRETSFGNTECALASLVPTIGSSHLIPQWDCISQLPADLRDSLPEIPNVLQEQKNETRDFKPALQQKPDIKIKKLADDQFEIISNTIRGGGIGEQEHSLEQKKIRKELENNGIRNMAVEVIPVVPDCPIGEHSRIQVIDGVEIDREATVSFVVTIPEQCVQSCRISSFPDGSRLPLLCRSAHFDRSNRKCSVYSDAINPNGYLDYKPNQKVIYMEKICIPDTVLPLSCDDVFRRIPQHILLGHASDVISVASEQECVLECIKSKMSRGMECHSILHYPDFPAMNCILNIHTRHSKKQYFTPEISFKVDYVELASCVSGSTTGTYISASSRSDIPPNPFEKSNLGEISGSGTVTEEWSEWTSCNDETSTRSRYRHCNGCKEIIQFLPCYTNNNFDVALQKFIKEQNGKDKKAQLVAEPAFKSDGNSEIPNAMFDTKNVVMEFPKKIVGDEGGSKHSVEFFGPPQSPSHAMSSF